MLKSMVMAALLVAGAATPGFAQHYAGVKGGLLNITQDIDFDGGAMVGVLFGYDMPGDNFSLEGEFNASVVSAESDNERYGDLDIWTLAAYGAFRTSGTFYFKGKAGLLYEELKSSVSGSSIEIQVDGGAIALSLGIGAGLRLGENLGAELEYTQIEADIGYATLGLNWMF
jgi:hypothetical protein